MCVGCEGCVVCVCVEQEINLLHKSDHTQG